MGNYKDFVCDSSLASSAYRTSINGIVLHSNAGTVNYRFNSIIWIKKIKLKNFKKVLARSQQPPVSI